MLLEQTEENTNSNNLEIAPLSFLVLVFCRIATIENGRSRGFINFHLLPSLDTIIANQRGGGSRARQGAQIVRVCLQRYSWE